MASNAPTPSSANGPSRRTSRRSETRAPIADAPLAEQHRRVWRALDQLAEAHGHSASSLAKLAGLDATAFNPSKRVARDGRLRWPGVETLTKVAEATGVGLRDIVALIDDRPEAPRYFALAKVVAQGSDWRLVPSEAEQTPMAIDDRDAFFLDLDADAPPLYRRGDRLLVSPNAGLTRNDRAVAARRGHVIFGAVARADAVTVTLAPFNGDAEVAIARTDADWIGKILWASQ